MVQAVVAQAKLWCDQCKKWQSGVVKHECFVWQDMGCWCCRGYVCWKFPWDDIITAEQATQARGF